MSEYHDHLCTMCHKAFGCRNSDCFSLDRTICDPCGIAAAVDVLRAYPVNAELLRLRAENASLATSLELNREEYSHWASQYASLAAKIQAQDTQLKGMAGENDTLCFENEKLAAKIEAVRALPAAFRKMEMYPGGNEQAMVNICADLLDDVLALLGTTTGPVA